MLGLVGKNCSLCTVSRLIIPPSVLQRSLWIKGLIFFHHGPRDMQEFPSGGTAGHFLGLTRFKQPAIKSLDRGVKPCRRQRRHVKSGS